MSVAPRTRQKWSMLGVTASSALVGRMSMMISWETHQNHQCLSQEFEGIPGKPSGLLMLVPEILWFSRTSIRITSASSRDLMISEEIQEDWNVSLTGEPEHHTSLHNVTSLLDF